MSGEMKIFVDHAREMMDKAIAHLEDELSKVRAGKANSSLVIDLIVDAYGMPTPLNQLANVSTPDAKTISIKPWDKGNLEEIEKAIYGANIGLTPQNDGETIRLNIPPLTEDRRKDLVKHAKAIGETAKISLRSARHDAIQHIKKVHKEEHLSEDMERQREEEVDQVTKEYGEKVDAIIAAKEKEVLTV